MRDDRLAPVVDIAELRRRRWAFIAAHCRRPPHGSCGIKTLRHVLEATTKGACRLPDQSDPSGSRHH